MKRYLSSRRKLLSFFVLASETLWQNNGPTMSVKRRERISKKVFHLETNMDGNKNEKEEVKDG
jgi:hypothetical protein